MSSSNLFQDFGSDRPAVSHAEHTSRSEIEDQKLEAFENGYQAGWEDAAKAQISTNTSVSAALASNLQDASFQYHEMRATMQKSVQEIMQMIVETLLPRIAQNSLGAHLKEEIGNLTQRKLDGKIQLATNTANLEQVENLCAENLTQPFELVSDPKLAEDQVVIRLADIETVIDLGRVVSEIGGAVSDYFQSQKSEASHD